MSGAAHAGWKGALFGVLENTIETMTKLGASRERIAASLGPSISQSNYEVGPEYVARFTDIDPAYADYFAETEKQGHALFDLKQFTIDRLTNAACEGGKSRPLHLSGRRAVLFLSPHDPPRRTRLW